MRALTICLMLWIGLPAHADKAAFLDLARQGWTYDLRTTMLRRNMAIPVHINGRDLAGASLCLVGERPHPKSLEIIDAFRALAQRAYGKPLTMRHAGPRAAGCGSGRTVVLRLYSGFPPNQALSDDLAWMNRVHQLGLPPNGYYAATSPAMGQTFFGRRGQGTHIMVKQPAIARLGRLERAFYKSILIEELFQSFTFGMDIVQFDRSGGFLSKLQETPFNLYRLSWDSRDFMRALVNSNPGGLCVFDVFMMHAVAEAQVDQTTDPAFIHFIDREYDRLMARTLETVADPRLAEIYDPDCARTTVSRLRED